MIGAVEAAFRGIDVNLVEQARTLSKLKPVEASAPG